MPTNLSIIHNRRYTDDAVPARPVRPGLYADHLCIYLPSGLFPPPMNPSPHVLVEVLSGEGFEFPVRTDLHKVIDGAK